MSFLGNFFSVDPEVYLNKGRSCEISGKTKQAAIYYELAAKKGNAEGMFLLALIYLGLDTSFSEYHQAEGLITKAAELGHGEAVDFLKNRSITK